MFRLKVEAVTFFEQVPIVTNMHFDNTAEDVNQRFAGMRDRSQIS